MSLFCGWWSCWNQNFGFLRWVSLVSLSIRKLISICRLLLWFGFWIYFGYSEFLVHLLHSFSLKLCLTQYYSNFGEISICYLYFAIKVRLDLFEMELSEYWFFFLFVGFLRYFWWIIYLFILYKCCEVIGIFHLVFLVRLGVRASWWIILNFMNLIRRFSQFLWLYFLF
jgi:hypothetical protein